jgi:hypothetical protein
MTLLFFISFQIPNIQIAKGEEASTRDYGPITPWLSPPSPLGTEHLGEVDSNGHIHIFSFPDPVCNNDWSHEDARASPSIGGQPVAGVDPLTYTGDSPLTSYVTAGPKEHVAGIFSNGHLIEISQTQIQVDGI